MAGFGSLYVVGGARLLYSWGLYDGGPVALWTSMLVTCVFMCITGAFLFSNRLPWLRLTAHGCTAACLAEICSSIPLSGSIYVWAAEAGGKKHGRFYGFVV